MQLHLFDIDVPGKITFQESKTLSPGDSFSTFDTRTYQISSPLSSPCRRGSGSPVFHFSPFPTSLQNLTERPEVRRAENGQRSRKGGLNGERRV